MLFHTEPITRLAFSCNEESADPQEEEELEKGELWSIQLLPEWMAYVYIPQKTFLPWVLLS